MVKIACIGAGYVGGVSSTTVWLQPTQRGQSTHLITSKHVIDRLSTVEKYTGGSCLAAAACTAFSTAPHCTAVAGATTKALNISVLCYAAYNGHDRPEVPRD
jgi:hypothetical protein